MSTIIIFLVVIVVLVVAHELGHFFVAKAFKVRVDEFGIGYPPRARKLFTWGGTLFTLNWLPFGGFVKIFGEEGAADDHKGSFAYQRMWKRILIVLAGIVANVILAIILYSISFGIGFLGSTSDFPGSIAMGQDITVVTSVSPASPAAGAGFETGDIVRALISGPDTSDPKSVDDIISFIKTHDADAISVSITRGGFLRTLTVTPKADPSSGVPMIGIGLTEATPIRLPFWRAIESGFSYTFFEFASIISSLALLIWGAFHGSGALLSQVSGPVGIAQIAGQAYQLGIGSFLSFVALISVNLAVINLLPFPALDGGRLVLELFASKGKSKIPAKVVSAVNQIGFLLLIVLMLYVTYHDIRHLVA